MVAIDSDLGAHALKLEHVHEAAFEDGFRDHARTLGNRHQSHHLRLDIRGKSRIRQRLYIHTPEPFGGTNADCFLLDHELGARFPQLGQEGLRMVRPASLYRDIPLRDRTGYQIGRRLDPIRNNLMIRAMQRRHPLDRDHVRPGSTDPSASRDQKLCEVSDLRLPSGIFNHRGAVGQAGSHHDIFGACDRRDVEINLGPSQTAWRSRVHVAVFNSDLGTHPLECGQMQVDRPGSDRTASGERYECFSMPGEKRAQHQNRGPHSLYQLIRRPAGGDFID